MNTPDAPFGLDPRHLPLDDLARLTGIAAARRDAGYGDYVSYSRKVFIPLTKLCRDVCHYCTFAQTPKRVEQPYLPIEKVLEIAHAGADAGCKEALFTLGDKPELRYATAASALAAAGYSTTVEYLHAAAERVLQETGLLPHLNPGVLSAGDMALLRPVSASMGLMLESTSARLAGPGGPHHGSPDKDPALRLTMIEQAGKAAIPFTTGLLIGIGETRAERIDAIAAIRDSHLRHGHIQEVIIQNFRAKPGTKMAHATEPDLAELLWTLAVARLMLPLDISLQAPPNLSPGMLKYLVDAGINDWGGVSPVTPDHVNPEAAWPLLAQLERETAEAGKQLVERLTLYPQYARNTARWADTAVAPAILNMSDAAGLARDDRGWRAGISIQPPPPYIGTSRVSDKLSKILKRAHADEELDAVEIATLFNARGGGVDEICAAANEKRRAQAGDDVTYVVTRNINYTNICGYRCAFCAFSKARGAESLRDKPYALDLDDVAARVREAAQRGAVEVCMQGGIHPHYTGDSYIDLCRAAKSAVPDIHIHAFSPLEISHGASTLGLSLTAFLEKLRDAGLASLPGTAAEILHDDVRAIICPDKLTTNEWLDVMSAAHQVGLRSTATIMFGHVDHYDHWAAHLIALRTLQQRTGVFTEFVPLPFVSDGAPIYRQGKARPGPTWREAILMHAVARLALGAWIPNIQASWVKLGPEGAARCLGAGANDLGGTLMNESITRAAGARHGQEMTPMHMEEIIRGIGRTPVQRTTLYRPVRNGLREQSFAAPALATIA